MFLPIPKYGSSKCKDPYSKIMRKMDNLTCGNLHAKAFAPIDGLPSRLRLQEPQLKAKAASPNPMYLLPLPPTCYRRGSCLHSLEPPWLHGERASSSSEVAAALRKMRKQPPRDLAATAACGAQKSVVAATGISCSQENRCVCREMPLGLCLLYILYKYMITTCTSSQNYNRSI